MTNMHRRGRHPLAKRGTQRLITGAIIFAIGLVITVVTYSMASSSPSGGTYIISWGPMLSGVLLLVRGLMDLSRARGAAPVAGPPQAAQVGQQYAYAQTPPATPPLNSTGTGYATAQPAPGWYADPHNPSVQRWWDGTNWTGRTQPR